MPEFFMKRKLGPEQNHKTMRAHTFICIVVFVFCSKPAISQDDVLSRIFFPNSYGVCVPLNNPGLKMTTLVSNGIEYRFQSKKLQYLRLSIDNFITDYDIDQVNNNNVNKAELRISTYHLGLGSGSKTEHWRIHCLLQAGFVTYRFPEVKSSNDRFQVDYLKEYRFSIRSLIGLDYYFTNNFALIAEFNHLYIPNGSQFWNPHFHSVIFTIGLSTTLF
jgi:hypothetical protein